MAALNGNPRTAALGTALAVILVFSSATIVSADDGADTRPAFSGGKDRNIVQVMNQANERFRLVGRVRLEAIKGPVAQPVNVASASATCIECRTMAVAFQIVLVEPGVTTMAPLNLAIARNVECPRCVTVAVADQHVVEVQDVDRARSRIARVVRELDQELDAIRNDQSLTFAEAAERVDAVHARFRVLAAGVPEALQHRTHADRDERHGAR